MGRKPKTKETKTLTHKAQRPQPERVHMLQIPQKPLEIKMAAGWQVHLPLNVYREMMHYVDKFDTECSGCGMVDMIEKDGNFVFTVTEIFLPDQKNTGATTDIEEDVVAKLVTRLVRENRPVEKLRFHWHSHVNMSVFHSGTDTDNYKTMSTGEWLISLVMNKKGEAFATVHYFKPFKLNAFNVPLYVTMADSVELPAWSDNIARVKLYEDAQRKKELENRVSKTYFNGHTAFGDGKSYCKEDYEDLGDKSWMKRRDACAQLAKDTLEIMMWNDEICLLGEVETVWGREAQCRAINLASGRVIRIQMEVEDVRGATEADFVEAQYANTPEV